jgi:hypothetical protein
MVWRNPRAGASRKKSCSWRPRKYSPTLVNAYGAMGGVTEASRRGWGWRISPKSSFSHRNQANQTRIGWRNGNKPSVLLGLI